MRQRREPVPRAREAWIWISSTALLLLLGGGATVAAVLLWENIDVRQLTPGLTIPRGPLPKPDSVRRAAHHPPSAFAAALFVSPRNRAYFPDPTYYRTELARWREVVRDAGGEVRDVADLSVPGAVSADEVLVLVETPCLSAAEVVAVRAHLARGGSLVSNWAVGVRDEACEWKGWTHLLEFTGAEDVYELPGRAGLYMAVPAGTPLSPGFDPGTRIELRNQPSLALRVSGPRVYWSDWALNPEGDRRGAGTDAASIALRTPSGGRVAWFGWRLGQAATPDDSPRVRRLARNGVLWAVGAASASISPWPGDARAALVFALDVEERPRHALDAVALFKEERIPATFFAVSQLAGADTALGEVLRAAGEVATQTVDHRPVAGLTIQDQTVRLRRSAEDIERWAGNPPTGFRPPEDLFDSLTLVAWQRVGGEYLVARNEGRTASPELHRTPGGTIVLLPRTIKDDYNVIVQDGALRGERIAEAYVDGMEKLHAIGGIAIVVGHTQIMESPGRLSAYRTAAQSARARGGWWIATGIDVARWWRARSATEVTFVDPAPPTGLRELTASGQPDVLVRNASGDVLRDAWVDLLLPRGPADVIPFVDAQPVSFSRTEHGIRVPVGTLQPGQERRVTLLVEQPEPAIQRGAN